jgi:hypothetical protein
MKCFKRPRSLAGQGRGVAHAGIDDAVGARRAGRSADGQNDVDFTALSRTDKEAKAQTAIWKDEATVTHPRVDAAAF